MDQDSAAHKSDVARTLASAESNIRLTLATGCGYHFARTPTNQQTPRLPTISMESETDLQVAAIMEWLKARHWTLSIAESVTAGRVQARISSRSGASEVFVGGLTAYAVATKIQLLGVSSQEAIASNGVSEAVARQMAAGACSLFHTDVAVATTGYADSFLPGPFAFVAVQMPDLNPEVSPRSFCRRHEVVGDRRACQETFATHAIALLWESLQGDLPNADRD